jgi:hypothetical protein
MLQTLFLLAAIGLTVSTILEAQLLFAKAAGKRIAESYAVAGAPRAQAFLLRQVAGEIAANGPSATLSPPPLPADCVSPTVCGLRITAQYTVTGSTAIAGGAATAENLQTANLAGEQRVAVQMAVDVIDEAGNIVAARTTYVTLRTFAAPPYAAFDGTLDAAADAATDAEPDTAGCDPANPGTCDPAATGPVDDTRIHVQLTCAENGNGGHCTGPAPVPSDVFANPNWTNGNVSSGGWSR